MTRAPSTEGNAMVRLAEVAATSQAVAATRSRKQKTEHLGALLSTLTTEEVPATVGFLCGEPRQGKLGLGYATLAALRSEPLPPESTVTVLELDDAFSTLRSLSGKGAGAERKRLLAGLFARLTEEERDFVSRVVLGELRQGALEAILLDAVALTGSVSASALRKAMLFSGDATQVAVTALTGGETALCRLGLELFRPLRPMLAQTAKDAADAFARAAPCVFEDKLDGARIQVHRSRERVAVYSRQGNDVTESVPEVVALAASMDADSFVLDGEVIALREDARPHAFQVTMRRFGRKQDVEALKEALPLHAYFFDCLYANGETLVALPNVERWEALAKLAPEGSLVRRQVVTSAAQGEKALSDALARGHEGVVVKSISSTYEAGRRGAAWLKVKPAPTLDLVVLAAEWGSGRRKGWLSNLHLGARDPKGGFVMLGKTFKGLTDAMLEWQTHRLKELAIRADGHIVFVRPELVVEIAFDGVQESPIYPGGLALRFARVRCHREDKAASEADTIDSVRAFYERSRR